jgi:hypothetical protein
VLEEHYERNRPVRPPPTRNLDKAATFQHLVQRAISSCDNDNNQADFEDDDDIEDDNDNTGTRAPRHSKTSKDAPPKPTTMKFYPQAWQIILVTAKNKMRRHVALVNAFPERENHLEEATAIITKTISEYRDKGIPLKGKSLHN